MIIQKLKPFVTSFSEAITKQYDHGTEVCVGGAITSIVDMTQFTTEEQIASHIDLGVYLTLDDAVGMNNVVVPKRMFDKFNEENAVHIGMIVLAVGKIQRLDLHEAVKRSGKFRNIEKHTEKTTRVLAYYLGTLPE